jgi:hypothetical protein
VEARRRGWRVRDAEGRLVDLGWGEGAAAWAPLREFDIEHVLALAEKVDEEKIGNADDQFTLSPRTRILREREAHAAAADLLFQCELFDGVAAAYRIGMAEIVELSQMFGASRHATFRRFAEQHRAPVAGIVLQRSPRTVSPLIFGREGRLLSSLVLDLANISTAVRQRSSVLERPTVTA